MPQGVEHGIARVAGVPQGSVRIPLMPQGVEHSGAAEAFALAQRTV